MCARVVGVYFGRLGCHLNVRSVQCVCVCDVDCSQALHGACNCCVLSTVGVLTRECVPACQLHGSLGCSSQSSSILRLSSLRCNPVLRIRIRSPRPSHCTPATCCPPDARRFGMGPTAGRPHSQTRLRRGSRPQLQFECCGVQAVVGRPGVANSTKQSIWMPQVVE